MYRNDHYGFWALSRYDDVVTAHRDWKTFTSTQGITIDMLTDPDMAALLKQSTGSMIFMDPPDHDRMRALVSRVFTPKAVADLEPMIRGLVRKYLDPLDGDEMDLVADFSGPFPVEVISVMLGVPEPDRQQIRHWTDEMLSREPGNPKPTPQGMEAGLNLGIYIHGLAAEKRRRPADDMISRLCEVGLSDDEVAGFSLLLAGAGSETVTKLIGGGVVLFARNPEQWRKVIDDRELLVPAVEEILRYWAPSQYQGRCSTVETEWHGVTIPADEPVLLITGAANRDERAYDGSRPLRHRAAAQAERRVRPRDPHVPGCGAGTAGVPHRVRRDRGPLARVRGRRGRCKRVNMSNVAGYSNVPVRVPHPPDAGDRSAPAV